MRSRRRRRFYCLIILSSRDRESRDRDAWALPSWRATLILLHKQQYGHNPISNQKNTQSRKAKTLVLNIESIKAQMKIKIHKKKPSHERSKRWSFGVSPNISSSCSTIALLPLLLSPSFFFFCRSMSTMRPTTVKITSAST